MTLVGDGDIIARGTIRSGVIATIVRIRIGDIITTDTIMVITITIIITVMVTIIITIIMEIIPRIIITVTNTAMRTVVVP